MMPTVLRVGGFRVIIRLPPREHEPPHVHVYKDGAQVVFLLPDGREAHPQVREQRNEGMSLATARAARRIVEEHAAYLLTKWREYHGEAK